MIVDIYLNSKDAPHLIHLGHDGLIHELACKYAKIPPLNSNDGSDLDCRGQVEKVIGELEKRMKKKD